VSVEPESAPRSLPGCPSPAVVVNPIHVDDLAQLHTQIARVCTELEWTPPLWLQTTIEDPGEGQARIALAAGADVVLACGGDGTVRHVARVLAGSGTPLAWCPRVRPTCWPAISPLGQVTRPKRPGLRCAGQTVRSTSVGCSSMTVPRSRCLW
jgi:hypothetical protein